MAKRGPGRPRKVGRPKGSTNKKKVKAAYGSGYDALEQFKRDNAEFRPKVSGYSELERFKSENPRRRGPGRPKGSKNKPK